MAQPLVRLAMAAGILGLCSCKPPTPADHTPIQTSGDARTNVPELSTTEALAIEELKSKLSEAIRTKSARDFVGCYHFEDRFDTPDVREANRKRVAILLAGETVDIEVREIPEKELIEVMKIQNAKPASAPRYSLVPRKMLWVHQRIENGTVGRGFLIGVKEGKWHIITFAGYTT